MPYTTYPLSTPLSVDIDLSQKIVFSRAKWEWPLGQLRHREYPETRDWEFVDVVLVDFRMYYERNLLAGLSEILQTLGTWGYAPANVRELACLSHVSDLPFNTVALGSLYGESLGKLQVPMFTEQRMLNRSFPMLQDVPLSDLDMDQVHILGVRWHEPEDAQRQIGAE